MMRAQSPASEYSVRDKLESVTLVDAENNATGSCGKIDGFGTGLNTQLNNHEIYNAGRIILMSKKNNSKNMSEVT
jgi:hypothetical protein